MGREEGKTSLPCRSVPRDCSKKRREACRSSPSSSRRRRGREEEACYVVEDGLSDHRRKTRRTGRRKRKLYSLPRLYSPRQCDSFLKDSKRRKGKKKMGFTMRASCAPFLKQRR